MEEYYEIRDMFVPFYLPITVENIEPEQIVELTKSDKKMEDGRVKFVLLHAIGDAYISREVSDEMLSDGIRYVLQ